MKPYGAVVIAAALLSACGGGGSPGTPAPSTTSETVTKRVVTAAPAANYRTKSSASIPSSPHPRVKRPHGGMNGSQPATEANSVPGPYPEVDIQGKDGNPDSVPSYSIEKSDAETGRSLGTVTNELASIREEKTPGASTTDTRYPNSSNCTNPFPEGDTATRGWEVPVWELNPNSNTPPTGYLSFDGRSIKTGSTLSGTLSAYDEEGNYPVAWTLNLKNGSTVAAKKSGSTRGESQRVNFAKLAAGTYAVELVLTDSHGETRTLTAETITVSAGDRPPVVSTFSSRVYVNGCSSSNTINILARASSPEGNAMTGAWTGAGTPLNGCSETSTPGFLTSACSDIPVPNTASTTYTFTATDSKNDKSGRSDLIVTNYATPPRIESLSAAPTLVPEGATGALRNVLLTASANNGEGVDMVGSWTVSLNGATATTACADTTLTAKASSTCNYTIPNTASKGDRFTFRFTASACGRSAFREVITTYAPASDGIVVAR